MVLFFFVFPDILELDTIKVVGLFLLFKGVLFGFSMSASILRIGKVTIGDLLADIEDNNFSCRILILFLHFAVLLYLTVIFVLFTR